jgi:Protein of unknown function (DUF1552)
VITRRGFLGGSVAAALLSRVAVSEPRRAPLRVLLVHKPVGTVPEYYDNGFILEPFAGLRERMVVVDGLENRKQSNTPGEDHANGIVTFMTGGVPFRPDGGSVLVAERESIDQILARQLGGDTPIRSLQLTADDRGHQFLLRVISSAGRAMPLPPEESPLAAFARVFGSLSDRPLSQKQSVLDFGREDLKRFSQVDVDRHLTAIREVERAMHRVNDLDLAPVRAEMRAATAARDDNRDRAHAQVGRAHLDLVRLAFQCDLTRVACFTWGSFTTNVAALVPSLATRTYHELSHSSRSVDEALVHHWYNAQLAAYLETLRQTPDIDGRTLLDNTLVVSWSEMRTGQHVFDNLPIQMFGAVAGGRFMRYPGYSTNDLWRTVLNAVGDTRQAFGDADKNSGRLVGLLPDSLR